VRLEQANLARARATLEAKRAAIGKALASAELARVTFARYRALHDRELIARQDLDVRSTELRVAEAEVENLRAETTALEAEVARCESAIRMAERETALARAALGVSESRLRDTSVHAPISGLILSRELEPGAVIVPGAPMFTMVDPATVWVRVNVDESLLGALDVGQRAEVTLRGSPGRTFAGRVVRIGEESDRVAEELPVEVRLDEPPAVLRIGQQAEASIITRAAPAATVLPAAAVVRDSRGARVFVMDGGRARATSIAIRATDPRTGDVEVERGLTPGDRVITGPPPFPAALADGQRVSPAER
jgi:HlyD family secretion protein